MFGQPAANTPARPRPSLAFVPSTPAPGNGTTDVVAAQPGTKLSALGELLVNFRLAKEAEDRAVAARREIGAQLALRIGTKQGGGTLHAEADGFKGTTSQSEEFKVNERGADALQACLPAPLFNRLVKFKPSIDAKEIKYIRANEPDIYKVIADHVDVKMGSISVSVEPVY